MVEGRWKIEDSGFLNEQQKNLIARKLAARITKEGFLLVKSQAERTQLGNKSIVVQKMNQLVNQALIVKTARIATRPTAGSKMKRLENKKQRSVIKRNRGKWIEE
jgi:ribosome-associated protein